MRNPICNLSDNQQYIQRYNTRFYIATVFDLYLLVDIEKVAFNQTTHAITAHQENSVLNWMIAHSRFAMHKWIMHILSAKFHKLPSFFVTYNKPQGDD